MRRDTIFWGSLLILFGVIFLLDNAGIFGDIKVWGLIWPLFLISFGVWILFNYFVRSSPDIKMLNLPAGIAEDAHIQFDYGGGRLYLKSGNDQEDLISGDFGGGVKYSVDTVAEKMDIRLQIPQRSFPYVWLPGTSSGISWHVALKNNFPLTLSLNMGACETNIDLSDLFVQRLVLKTGVSSTKLILPKNAGNTSVRIDAGVASVDVRIPDSVAARISTSVGLGSVSVDRKRFPKKGGIYMSSGYETAVNKVDIDISGGISSINIR